jgi:ribonuclease P protein component
MRTEHLDVRASDSLLSHVRAAVIVGKLGHTIVERNRLRRRLRELVRTIVLPETEALDVVIKALEAAYDASFVELRKEVEQIREKLRRARST